MFSNTNGKWTKALSGFFNFFKALVQSLLADSTRRNTRRQWVNAYLRLRNFEVVEWDDASKAVMNLGPRPKGMFLDRIDRRRNYEPGNVRWADSKA